MAHLLDLVESGTVNLAGTATSGVYIKLMEYTPQVGFEINENATVTETAQVEIRGTAAADIAAAYGSINRYFQQARTWQSAQVGTPVFVHYQPDGYAAAYRSEVIDGRVQIVEGGLNYPRWNNFRALVDVSWERRNYWEGLTLTAATLSNNNGTTTQLTLFVVNDGTAVGGYTRINWANIAANQITGDLPAPARIEIFGTSLVTSRNFYLTNSWSSNSGTDGFCQFVEMETTATIAGYLQGTTVAAGTGLWSNSSAIIGTLTAGTTLGRRGTIASANLAGVGGQAVALFLGGRLDTYGDGDYLYNSGSDVYYRADWTTALGDPLYSIAAFPWQGIEVMYGGIEAFSPLLLGVAKHPNYGSVPPYDEFISVYAKRGGTANVPVVLDYIAAVAYDSMVYLGTATKAYSSAGIVIHDPYIGGISFVDNVDPGSYITQFLAPSGQLYLQPNKTQQIRVWGMRNYDENLGQFFLTIKYRPRRLAL